MLDSWRISECQHHSICILIWFSLSLSLPLSLSLFTVYKHDAPPKFNIAPEKWCLEDYLPIGKATFQGLY